MSTPKLSCVYCGRPITGDSACWQHRDLLANDPLSPQQSRPLSEAQLLAEPWTPRHRPRELEPERD